MKKYIVTPIHVSGLRAPFICVEVPSSSDETERKTAVRTAREASRLADFESWSFIPAYNPARKGVKSFKPFKA